MKENKNIIHAYYKPTPIRSLDSLAKALNLDKQFILKIAQIANSQYRIAKQILKPDGSVRVTYDAKPFLKNIHRKIKINILSKVHFPHYLTGSIRGRDYKTNANLHIEAKIVICEDIASFFPNTSDDQVFEIWRKFFRFSDDVAHCLTQLTTKDGAVPQGAITSSYLTNLVFWRDEPLLYASLAAKGITYSRLVDDITVSSANYLTNQEKSDVIKSIYAMLNRRRFHPKRAKHELRTSRERMIATKLGVNKKPGLSSIEQANIRSAVKHLERMTALTLDKTHLASELAKVSGKLSHLGRFHPGKAAALKQRVQRVKILVASM